MSDEEGKRKRRREREGREEREGKGGRGERGRGRGRGEREGEGREGKGEGGGGERGSEGGDVDPNVMLFVSYPAALSRLLACMHHCGHPQSPGSDSLKNRVRIRERG